MCFLHKQRRVNTQRHLFTFISEAQVIKLMDEMVVKLGVEQEDDDAQKKWCESEFDTTEDESGCKQVLSRRLRNQTRSSDHEPSILDVCAESRDFGEFFYSGEVQGYQSADQGSDDQDRGD